MKKEIGRWTQPDGSIRVHYEEPLAGDFGQKQSFETLPPEDDLLLQNQNSEPTPGQVISDIGFTAFNFPERPLDNDTN